jgi:hypothetical protein
LTPPVKTGFKVVFLGFLGINEKDHRRIGSRTVLPNPSDRPIGKDYANQKRDEN